MIIKKIPEDFYVEEIFDFEKVKKRNENKKSFYYFYLTKNNYSQMMALEKVSKIFHISRKRIHFAGTKDKVAITKQVISLYDLDENNFMKNLEYFNKKFNDLKLEFIGKFNSRINLGDNIGNYFKIIVRDLEKNEIDLAKNNIRSIKENGVLNYFDSQRFGYANNSHIIGKYIIRNDFDLAIKEILTSTPQNPSIELGNYLEYIKENIDEILNSNKEILEKSIELIPKHRKEDLEILKHLLKFKNDYLGAFRKIHKKIRTLYVNAYQSYIFNKILDTIDIKKLPEEIELIHKEIKFEIVEIENLVNKLLKEDKVDLKDFEFKSMPEYKFNITKRKTKIFPKDLEIYLEGKDDLTEENKLKLGISFKLGSGEYATNVISKIFNK